VKFTTLVLSESEALHLQMFLEAYDHTAYLLENVLAKLRGEEIPFQWADTDV
jgi:hypothetical protein